LAHIRRGDLWVNLVQTVLQIVYFYNPLLWVANAVIRRVREQAVDEAVLVAMGEGARQYPRTLVNVAKLAFGRPALSLRLIGVVESKSALKGRVKRILERPLPKTAKLGIAGLIMVLFFGSILLPMAKFEPGPPNFVVKGTVTDAETGQPIAGAKVGDNKEYNEGKFCTVTDSDGNYEYKTWYEEHFTKCEAAGYKTEKKILLTKLFGSEKEKVIDFALTRGGDSGPSEFEATLPNGVTVELIGVCEHPSAGKQWWRPDGMLLEKAPYHTMGSRLTHDEGYSDYEFVLRVEKLADADYKVDVPGGRHGTYTGTPYDQEGERVEDLRVYTTNQPKDKDITLVRIGATADKWQTRAVYKPDDKEKTYDFDGQSVAFSKPYEDNGDTVLPFTHNLNKPKVEIDVRIAAIKKDGRIRLGSCSGSGGNILSSLTYRFESLPLEEIKQFEFQTRPFEWVAFKNVSLKPNFKTDVQVEVEKSAGQVGAPSNLEVLDIDFEPIHQGKNVVRVKVKNKSGEEQVFGIHIYTRSVDYGPQGVGWGRVFFDKIEAGETKTVTSPFHIQGPVTKNTWLRLKFYNPESVETYDYYKPFQQKRFASGDLQRQQVMATAEELKQLSKALEVIKAYIRDGEYKNAWQLFTEDYQQVQFGRDGLERFERAMEPTHPIDSAFWWEREDFLSLKPLEAIYTDGTYKLTAQSLNGEAWTIDFVKEDEVWKIDWIAGYKPGIFDIQEADRFRELLEEAVSVDIDNSPGSDRLSVQYAVMAICEAAGVPYQWEKSAELADQQQRQYTEPVHIKDVTAKDALADILEPVGLSYSLDEAGLYLHKTD
jgi:hypothetical protein